MKFGLVEKKCPLNSPNFDWGDFGAKDNKADKGWTGDVTLCGQNIHRTLFFPKWRFRFRGSCHIKPFLDIVYAHPVGFISASYESHLYLKLPLISGFWPHLESYWLYKNGLNLIGFHWGRNFTPKHGSLGAPQCRSGPWEGAGRFPTTGRDGRGTWPPITWPPGTFSAGLKEPEKNNPVWKEKIMFQSFTMFCSKYSFSVV